MGLSSTLATIKIHIYIYHAAIFMSSATPYNCQFAAQPFNTGVWEILAGDLKDKFNPPFACENNWPLSLMAWKQIQPPPQAHIWYTLCQFFKKNFFYENRHFDI